MSKVLTGNETVSIIGNYAKSKATLKEIAEFAEASGGVTEQEVDQAIDKKVDALSKTLGAELEEFDKRKANINEVVVSVNGASGSVTIKKSDVGLGNVDNTADSAKPVSTAQKIALDKKVDLLNIQKTYNSSLPVEHVGEAVDLHKLDFGEHLIRTDTAINAPEGTKITLVQVIKTHEEVGGGLNGAVQPPSVFEQGTISESSDVGTTYDKAKYPPSEPLHGSRIRTKDLIAITEFSTITVAKDYEYCVISFDSNKKYLGRSSYQSWDSASRLTYPNAKFIGIAIRKGTLNTPITVEDATTASLKITTLGNTSGGSKLMIAWGALKGDLHTCVNIAGAWSNWTRISTPLPVDANEGDHLIYTNKKWTATTSNSATKPYVDSELLKKIDLPKTANEDDILVFKSGKWVAVPIKSLAQPL